MQKRHSEYFADIEMTSDKIYYEFDLLPLNKIMNNMITKTQIINSLDQLPENLTIDQVVDHLIFLEKVQKGPEDSEKGKINTKEEAKKKLRILI